MVSLEKKNLVHREPSYSTI